MEGGGFIDQGSGLMVHGSGFRVQGSGFRVQGSGFRVQGSGFGRMGLGVGYYLRARFRANLEQVRQSRPDSGLGFQVRVLQRAKALPFGAAADCFFFFVTLEPKVE